MTKKSRNLCTVAVTYKFGLQKHVNYFSDNKIFGGVKVETIYRWKLRNLVMIKFSKPFSFKFVQTSDKMV